MIKQAYLRCRAFLSVLIIAQNAIDVCAKYLPIMNKQRKGRDGKDVPSLLRKAVFAAFCRAPVCGLKACGFRKPKNPAGFNPGYFRPAQREQAFKMDGVPPAGNHQDRPRRP
jgi:hypothetical protein